ncbi:hypothetical protein SPB21_18890 [Leptothoe sp. ISB3NOV94-8A]
MSGPSYFVRLIVKGAATACGADPITANILGRTANVGSSLIFHDHHTHFHVDPDEMADAHSFVGDHLESAGDLQRSGISVHDLKGEGFNEGTNVFVSHENWQSDHWGKIEDFRNPGPDDVDVKIEVDSKDPRWTHNHEWVDSDQISLEKPY